MKRNLKPRGESVFWFANTANAASVRMNRKLGINGYGPESWLEMRYSVIHFVEFFKMICARKLFHRCREARGVVRLDTTEESVLYRGDCEVRRLLDIDFTLFESFWNTYLDGNQGLVTSRSALELDWVFGDGVRTGREVLLGAFEKGRIIGYVVMTSGVDGWWRVLDLIALDNDLLCLSLLLVAAKKFLRKRTKAALLSMRGCPPGAECIVRKAFPHYRALGRNPFLWHFTDNSVAKRIGDLTCMKKGWFFGPYDGDACL